MQIVEIDFEVFKALTALRETEATTHNDVIRRLLNLPAVDGPAIAESSAHSVTRATQGVADSGSWSYKGVRFPEGTEFRATYQGTLHYGRVRKGRFEVNGRVAASPSDGARLITENSVNGWTFWECRFPGQVQWRMLKSLRQPSQ